MSDGGKGSSPRPFSISQDEYSNNWNRIFRKNQFNDIEKEPVRGDQRVNQHGQLEQFDQGYWQEIYNKN